MSVFVRHSRLLLTEGAIYLFGLVIFHLPSRHQEQADNALSPTGQWRSRAVPLPAKDSRRARLAGSDWPAHLPWVMLGLRAAPREYLGISATELVYGCPLSLPGQFITGSELPPTLFIRQLNSSLPCVADNSHRSPAPPASARRLQEAAFVYVRREILRAGGRRLTPSFLCLQLETSLGPVTRRAGPCSA